MSKIRAPFRDDRVIEIIDREERLPDNRKRWGKVGDDVVDLMCAYNDHGMLCKRRGTVSDNTGGRGPWYCRDHAWVILHDNHAPKESTARQSAFEDIHKIIPRAVRRESVESAEACDSAPMPFVYGDSGDA